MCVVQLRKSPILVRCFERARAACRDRRAPAVWVTIRTIGRMGKSWVVFVSVQLRAQSVHPGKKQSQVSQPYMVGDKPSYIRPHNLVLYEYSYFAVTAMSSSISYFVHTDRPRARAREGEGRQGRSLLATIGFERQTDRRVDESLSCVRCIFSVRM